MCDHLCLHMLLEQNPINQPTCEDPHILKNYPAAAEGLFLFVYWRKTFKNHNTESPSSWCAEADLTFSVLSLQLLRHSGWMSGGAAAGSPEECVSVYRQHVSGLAVDAEEHRGDTKHEDPPSPVRRSSFTAASAPLAEWMFVTRGFISIYSRCLWPDRVPTAIDSQINARVAFYTVFD